MSVNVNSISDARDAWINYRYGDNTRGISAAEISAIESRWSCNLSDWKTQGEKDKNDYEFTEDDKNSTKDKTKEDLKERTGFDGKADSSGGAMAATIGVSVVAAGGAAAAGATATAAVTAAKASAEAAKHNSKDTNSVVGAAALLGATTLMYATARMVRSSDPNGEAVRAIQEFQGTILPEAEENLSVSEATMTEATENINETVDELDETNEDTNDEIKETNDEFVALKERVMEIQEKAESGVPLTEDEKEFLELTLKALASLGEYITDMSDENSDLIKEKYDEIFQYQSDYDDAANTIAQVQAITDFMAQFDEQTISNAQLVQDAAQIGEYGAYTGLAGSALVVAKGISRLGTFLGAPTGWAMIALGGASALASTGAKDQFGKLKNEQIDYEGLATEGVAARVNTQDFTAEVNSSYEDQIDNFDNNVATVEDLEIDVPKDLETPEVEVSSLPTEDQNTGTAAPTTGGTADSSGATGGAAGGTPTTGGTQQDDKNKKPLV